MIVVEGLGQIPLIAAVMSRTEALSSGVVASDQDKCNDSSEKSGNSMLFFIFVAYIMKSN